MFTSPTVMIVGAGASMELGFPSGTGLLASIVADLKYAATRDSAYDPAPNMRQVLAVAATDPATGSIEQRKLDALLTAGVSITRVAAGAGSIDSIISERDDDPLIAEVGRMAITHQLLQYESKCPLSELNLARRPFDLEHFDKVWLFEFFLMLKRHVKASEIARVFANLTIICFNYDRTIEKFIPLALQQTYPLGMQDALACCRQLRIYHPYGSIGHLPGWPVAGVPEVRLGYYEVARIPEIALGISTFGESRKHEWRNEAIQRIKDARHIVFVGFGYDRLNLNLLTFEGHVPIMKRYFLNVCGLEPADAIEVKRTVTSLYKNAAGHPAVMDISDSNLEAKDFLRLYSRALTS